MDDAQTTAQQPYYELRSLSQYVKGGALLVFAAFIAVISYFDPYERTFLAPTVIALAVAALAWVFCFAPVLRMSPRGVHVVNSLREYFIPWPELDYVDTRFGLYLVAQGGRRYAVSSFPGRGGLSHGVESLRSNSSTSGRMAEPGSTASNRAARGGFGGSMHVIPLAESGQLRQRATVDQATSLLRRMLERSRQRKWGRADGGVLTAQWRILPLVVAVVAVLAIATTLYLILP